MNRKSKKNYYSDLFLNYKDNIKKQSKFVTGPEFHPCDFPRIFFSDFLEKESSAKFCNCLSVFGHFVGLALKGMRIREIHL